MTPEAAFCHSLWAQVSRLVDKTAECLPPHGRPGSAPLRSDRVSTSLTAANGGPLPLGHVLLQRLLRNLKFTGHL